MDTIYWIIIGAVIYLLILVFACTLAGANGRFPDEDEL